MTSKIEINGDYVVCSKINKKDSQKYGEFEIYNKENMDWYMIESINSKEPIDFPFSVGDTVCSASTGTIVDLNNTKLWLFKPEHILAKICV